jgi:hypothetical protein
MGKIINIHVEKLQEGYYLATFDAIQELIHCTKKNHC